MRTAAKLLIRLAIFATGLLLAVAISSSIGAADTTTTTALTTTVPTTTSPTTGTETAPVTTTTSPVTTSVTTTVRITTTTKLVPVRTGTPTTTSSEGSSTPAWVWVLLGILAVALVVVIVLLGRRGGGDGTMPLEDRRRQLEAAVGTWAAQGWAIETQTDDSAVLRRPGETMLVNVDRAGHVSTRPVPGS